ncbi:hypothetical protein ACIQZG_22750 [Lysinibacillus sp. NPDC096418]|uniref:hypothetical protein n=1 Tax=Lysinibacillus sp. NPDC096418 TaxID=3364138 RepID=UPI00382A3EE3
MAIIKQMSLFEIQELLGKESSHGFDTIVATYFKLNNVRHRTGRTQNFISTWRKLLTIPKN